MTNKKEEREFKLEMLKVQIEHRDEWSKLTKRETTYIAIGFSLMVSFVLAFFGIFVKTLDVNWFYASIVVMLIYFTIMVVLVCWYDGKYRASRENLNEKLEKIQEKFIGEVT